MATPGNNSNMGKKDRREAAREKARQDREAERKRTRRNKIFIQSGVGVAVIVIAAIIMLVVVSQPKPAELSTSKAGPQNMITGGILLQGPDATPVKTAAYKAGAKPTPTDPSDHPKTVNIVSYIDFQCPACQAFENTNAAQILSWVKSGLATIEVHPISFLDPSSLGNQYSTRAANAAACVANYKPNKFYSVTEAFFEHQPKESTHGRTDKELLSVMSDAGAKSQDITDCVKTQKFVPWVTATSNYVRQNPFPNTKAPKSFSGTPTVFVNGQQFTGGLTDAAAFTSFVEGIATANGK